MHFLIVTGMSGAGKSRAVAVLEDLGYYCVDNLPIPLIPKFAEVCLAATEQYDKVALVTDVRAGDSFKKLFISLDSIRDMGCDYRILFLDTATQTLINRYKETRRKHPLMNEGLSLAEAIDRERIRLEDVRGRADYVVDTTKLTAAGLREHLVRLFAGTDSGQIFQIIVESFGFKHGIPTEADLVFDVRFLPNPYYIAELKECTGLEEAVRSFLFGYRQTTEFMRHLEELFAFLLPQYVEEGKSSLVIAIGCTGGHHRSVAVAHALAEFVRQKGYRVEEAHRDITR